MPSCPWSSSFSLLLFVKDGYIQFSIKRERGLAKWGFEGKCDGSASDIAYKAEREDGGSGKEGEREDG